MRQCHRSPTSPRQTETKSQPPCAGSISRLWLRNKTDMHWPVARPTQPKPPGWSRTFSCDDPEPFHFPIKPNAVNHQREGGGERCDRAGEINRRAFDQIDPNAPGADAQREEGRENYEDDMKRLE